MLVVLLQLGVVSQVIHGFYIPIPPHILNPPVIRRSAPERLAPTFPSLWVALTLPKVELPKVELPTLPTVNIDTAAITETVTDALKSIDTDAIASQISSEVQAQLKSVGADERVQALGTAIQELPDAVGKTVIPDGYFTSGRGKEILELIDKGAPAVDPAAVVLEPINSAKTIVEGYWTKGRGKEILSSLDQAKIVDQAVSATTSVGEAVVQSLPTDAVPPEVASAITGSLTDTFKVAQDLAEYTTRNSVESIKGAAGSLDSIASSVQTAAQSSSDQINKVAAAVSSIPQGFGTEVEKASTSIARVYEANKDVKIDEAVGQLVKSVVESIPAADPNAVIQPLGSALSGLQEGLVQSQAALGKATEDIVNLPKAAGDTLSTTAKAITSVELDLSKVNAAGTRAAESINSGIEQSSAVIQKVNSDVTGAFKGQNSQQLVEEVADATTSYFKAGLRTDTIERLKEAFKDYPATVKKTLDLSYWETGRGKEILEFLNGPSK